MLPTLPFKNLFEIYIKDNPPIVTQSSNLYHFEGYLNFLKAMRMRVRLLMQCQSVNHSMVWQCRSCLPLLFSWQPSGDSTVSNATPSKFPKRYRTQTSVTLLRCYGIRWFHKNSFIRQNRIKAIVVSKQLKPISFPFSSQFSFFFLKLLNFV